MAIVVLFRLLKISFGIQQRDMCRYSLPFIFSFDIYILITISGICVFAVDLKNETGIGYDESGVFSQQANGYAVDID